MATDDRMAEGDAVVEPEKRRKSRLGPHDWMLLDHWGHQLHDAFNARSYLVGSAGRGEHQWRDVDVRILLPDDAAWLGEIDGLTDTIQSIRLRTVNLAISLWGRQVTGLPTPSSTRTTVSTAPRSESRCSCARARRGTADRRSGTRSIQMTTDRLAEVPRFDHCAACHRRTGVFVQEPGPDGALRWVCQDDPVGCMSRALDLREFIIGVHSGSAHLDGSTVDAYRALRPETTI